MRFIHTNLVKSARQRLRMLSVVAIIVAAITPAAGEARGPLAANFADLTLEELSNIKVTSVSRRAQRLTDAPAAVYVIDRDEIRRSGANTLPEALRLAPNLQVARADAVQYAITARGFNSVLANKLLVMIDGRTVYSPLFSGVFWEAQSVMLEDVERIEVVGGPGGTLWGSNAVNGVINIITRSAQATPGALITAGAGTIASAGGARYGGSIGSTGHYRVYGHAYERNSTIRADRSEVGDASQRGQGGFRTDWSRERDAFTVLGDASQSDIDQGTTARRITGANLLGRWNRELQNGLNLSVQGYFDHTERYQPGAITEQLNTFDIEFQHELIVRARHNLLWGAGARHQADRVKNLSPAFGFRPANRDLDYANVFAQDAIRLHEKLNLIVGLKVERNDFTGFEYLPEVRLAWNPDPDRLVWSSVSRAVRAPSRIDREFFSPAESPHFVLAGGPDFESEVSNVAELGYRAHPNARLSYSITGFHHRYDRLRSIEPTAAGPEFRNRIEGSNTGVGVWGSYRIINALRVTVGGVRQDKELSLEPGSADVASLASLGNDPRYWWLMRSSLDLGGSAGLDVVVRRVGALPNPSVPAYTAVDGRVGWRVGPSLELGITGHNLFDALHPEWGIPYVRPEFKRTAFFEFLWRM